MTYYAIYSVFSHSDYAIYTNRIIQEGEDEF